MGSCVFSGEVLLHFEGQPRPLLDSLRFPSFGLLNEEVIGFTFASVVSFLSCYYIRIIDVVRVRTILLFLFGKATITCIADVDRRPLSIILGSVHSKKSRGWMHGGHCKSFFEFLLN